VSAPFPIVGIADGAHGDDGGRATAVELIAPEQLEERWRPARATRVFERTFSDGTPMLTVDHDTEAGYRFWAPRHGSHVVAPDGRTIRSAPPSADGWWWQRLLLAQVLPVAATLQGVELLHASAVAVDGRALAVTASAGSGKTSLAAHLLDLGADFVADDVLALELVDGHVEAHPGTGLMNLDPDQRRSLGDATGRFAELPGDGETNYVVVPVVDAPLPLGALYFLHRAAQFAEARIVDAQDTRVLLGSTFVSYLSDPERLLTHLEICGAVDQTVPAFVVEAPLEVSADRLARLVRDHAGSAP
jgi:hypothetical protein